MQSQMESQEIFARKEEYEKLQENLKRISKISQKKTREISGMREDRESFCDQRKIWEIVKIAKDRKRSQKNGI